MTLETALSSLPMDTKLSVVGFRNVVLFQSRADERNALAVKVHMVGLLDFAQNEFAQRGRYHYVFCSFAPTRTFYC